MKIRSVVLALILGMVAISCTEKTNIYNIEIENVTVSLETSKLIAKVVQSPMMLASTTPLPSQEYTHVFPDEFKAYFVAAETKGQYQQNQLIKTIDVVEGANTITIPAIKYRVIVTNHIFTNTNNLLNQNREQLPQKSSVIYLYGHSDIDYSSVSTGEVEVTNDYAALQVFKNEITPTKGADFFDTPHWYVIYVRHQNGNTNIGTNVQIPIKKINGSTDNYNSSQSFPTLEANKIHKIVFTHDVGNGAGGNLTVKVQEDILEEVVSKTITIN